MTIARIATYYQTQDSLRSLQIASDGLAQTTYQITSGNKAQNLTQLGSSANQVLNLSDTVNRIGVYQTAITGSQNQLQSTESTLQSMLTMLQDAVSTTTLGRNENDAATRASLAPKLQSIVQSFYNAMQTQFGGHYLFSGQNALTPPITGSGAATAYANAQPSSSWYKGDSSLPEVMTGPGTTQQYGVLGNDPAFQDMKSGLEAIWYGLQNNSTTDIDSGSALLASAQSGVSALLGQVGGQLSSLGLNSDNNTAQQNFVQGQLDSMQKADLASAMTTFSQQQATLQASMLIISKINQVSLLDYLH